MAFGAVVIPSCSQRLFDKRAFWALQRRARERNTIPATVLTLVLPF